MFENEVLSRIGAIGLDGYVIKYKSVYIAEIDSFCGQDLTVDVNLGIGGGNVGHVFIILLYAAVKLKVDVAQGNIFKMSFGESATV